jgi:hypothetical protein
MVMYYGMGAGVSLRGSKLRAASRREARRRHRSLTKLGKSSDRSPPDFPTLYNYHRLFCQRAKTTKRSPSFT